MIRAELRHGVDRRAISPATPAWPGSVSFTFPEPSTSNQLTLTFNTSVEIVSLPNWTVRDGTNTRTVTDYSRVSASVWILVLSGIVNGPTEITVPQHSLAVRTYQGGVQLSGVFPPVPFVPPVGGPRLDFSKASNSQYFFLLFLW